MEIPVQAEKESGWQIRQTIRRRDVERIRVATVSYTHLRVLYTPPVTPWELVMPEVSDPTARRELPKAGLITGVKS